MPSVEIQRQSPETSAKGFEQQSKKPPVDWVKGGVEEPKIDEKSEEGTGDKADKDDKKGILEKTREWLKDNKKDFITLGLLTELQNIGDAAKNAGNAIDNIAAKAIRATPSEGGDQGGLPFMPGMTGHKDKDPKPDNKTLDKALDESKQEQAELKGKSQSLGEFVKVWAPDGANRTVREQITAGASRTLKRSFSMGDLREGAREISSALFHKEV